jgi:ribosomal protein S24E
MKFNGFKKKKGEFERYNEILNRNKMLVVDVHSDPQPTKAEIRNKQKKFLPRLD